MEKILVVDDEIEVCNSLKKFLVKMGYGADTALNGKEAISKVKETRPHIVLLDIIMPGMGGMDTLKEIKKVDPNIGIIMLTAVKDEELAKRALELGAYEYILKPFDLNYLETVLRVKIIDVTG